jgi:hypothetical protein
MDLCEGREATNTLLFGGLLGASLELPLADFAAAADFTPAPAALSASSADATPVTAPPARELLDPFALATVPRGDSSDTGRPSAAPLSTPAAGPANDAVDPLGAFFELSGDEGAAVARPPAGTDGPATPPTEPVGTPTAPASPPVQRTAASGGSASAPTGGSPVALAAPPSGSPRLWAPLPVPVPPHLVVHSGQAHTPPPTTSSPKPGTPSGNTASPDGIAPDSPTPPGGGEAGCCCCTPHVKVEAIDRIAGLWRANEVHGTSTGAFLVRRSGDLGGALTVAYTVQTDPGNPFLAAPGVDYNALSGTVTIPAGQRAAAIMVQPIEIADAHIQKDINLTLSPSSDYIIDGATATVWISQNAGYATQPYYEDGYHFPVPSVIFDNLDGAAAELPGGQVSTGVVVVWRGGYSYDWGTLTNTAAVTVPYPVNDPWSTATAGADYNALPGSVTLGQAVFAAAIPLTPVDDPLLEGAEEVWVTPTPGPSYQITYNAAVAIEIGDLQNGEDPVAYDDTYAMSADDTSLTIPPAGVLCNDVCYGDGTLTAGPSSITTDLGGTVAMSPGGGFTYTPTADLRASGGTDSFSYAASYTDLNGVQHSAWATAFINVVRMTLTMPNGPWVPVNANNDNNSGVTNEIPATRDFNAPGPFAAADPELMPVNVGLPLWMQLNGQFVIRFDQTASGGHIKLWKDPKKGPGQEITSGMAFTRATLPTTFYVEGTNPTIAVPVEGGGYDPRPDVKIWLTYIELNCPQFNVQIGATSADVVVTPVITRFNMLPGVVDTILFQVPVPPNDTLVRGLQTLGAGPGQPAGMTFNAVLDRRNLEGDMIYIQNAGIPGNGWAVVNDQGLGRGGYRSTNAPTSADSVLKDSGGTIYLQVIDRPGTGHQPGEPPDYYAPGHPELTPGSYPPSAGYVERYAYDFPSVGLSEATAKVAANTTWIRGWTNISVEFNFRMYVVWRFPMWTSNEHTIIYTVGTRDWHVVFRMTGTQAGGFSLEGSKVEPLGDFDPTNHFNPIKLVGPDFNDLITVVAV